MVTEYLLAITFFVIVNGFFAGSEAALTAINRIRLRHLVESGDRRAIAIERFLSKEGQFLGTTLVGTNLAVIVSSALATQLFGRWLGGEAAFVSTAVMTVIILIFGEVIPKTIFRQSANAISAKIIVPLTYMHKALYPIIFVATSITDAIMSPFKKRAKIKEQPFITRKDIESVLGMKKRGNIVILDRETLIQRIFKLGRTRIGDIMTPLKAAVSVGTEDTAGAVKALAKRTRYSRFPVYEGRPGNIVGTVTIYDLLFDAEGDRALRAYVQAPLYIHQRMPVDEVLSQLRKKKKPMAIVIDEAGASVGLVTIEDLLEEIVGEIEG